ncbi:LysR family transcriptional regulator [Bordetella ansorpii]|uniref:LysR family transcriptional regulator n=1 Tax=Bordetella ansorpii TaxID=288768 RepID=A0A157LWH9_9BORD|nr:LysR family transcriptional regulator [Bordetella ansorpii]SAI01058.1 LysR family transcriptional regulator [Bordetella ansorpii]
MITIKQVEAFYWTVKLGTFTAAAERLHTTQSAITKRVQDIENIFGVALFDRVGHRLVLTDRAKSICDFAKNMLQQRDAMLVQLAGNPAMTGTVRIGITEMTAMTWISTLIRQTRARYPSLQLQPRLDLSGKLQRLLLAGELDLAFLPEMYLHPDLDALPLAPVEFGWMGSPNTFDQSHRFSVEEIGRMAILGQSSDSVISAISDNWLQQRGQPYSNVLAIDNLVAIAGLAVAGLGVVCLPMDYFAEHLRDGRLAVLRTEVPPPSARYFALFRREPGSVLAKTLAALAQECCDFTVESR